jgi:DNA segregation ATPase FtsK/SpoIIIE, S-DNA-T family
MEITSVGPLALGAVAVTVVGWGAVRLIRWTIAYYQADTDLRANMRLVIRVRRRWAKLAPNVGLVRVDENSKRQVAMDGTKKPEHRIYPAINAVPTPYGFRAWCPTIPGVGLAEFEKASAWLADAWGAEVVEVKRPKPGVVELRALVTNPLDRHHPYAFPDVEEWRLPIGLNPWGDLITVNLRDLSGIKVAGMPGYGKTMLMLGWLGTLARSGKVQFAIFDGKTADPRYGDWGEVGQRAMLIVGDNPEAANQALTELVRLIKDRPAQLVAERGTHKFWRDGPTETIPLVLVLMDECHNYIDASGLKGKDKELIEANQRLMRTVAKEGRGLGVIPIVGTQKQTTDAIPSAVRDNLEVGICFAVFTIDAAIAALGDGIRADEPNHPMALLDKDRFQGVCVVTGVPGLAGRYDRVRVGDIDEAAVVQLVDSAGHLRRDVIPAPAPTVRDVSAESAGTTVPLQKTQKRKTA